MPLHPASVCMLGIWTQVLSLKGKQSTNQDVFLASDFRLLISCLSLLSKVDRISGLQHQVPLEQGLLYPPSQSPLTQSSSWLSYSCITFPNALSNYLRLSGLRLWIKEGMKSLRVFVAIDLCVPLCLAFNKAFFSSTLTVLWHEGDELLHGPVRSVEGTGCAGPAHLEQSPRLPSREAQVHEHRWSDEVCGL